jgi:hypothetical protein
MISFERCGVGERQRLGFLIEVPFLGLSARIGRFEAPFEYLRGTKTGFKLADRFLLNRSLAGDEEAIAAREQRILSYIPQSVSGADQRQAALAYHAYFQAHAEEIDAFARAEYPRPAIENIPYEPPSKPADLNRLLDELVIDAMSDYGFDLRRRSQSKSHWACQAELSGMEITLQFNKKRSDMSGFITISDLLYYGNLGAPFFFADVSYDYTAPSIIRAKLRAMLGEYSKVFPHVLEAVQLAVPIRDTYLAGDEAGAIQLARSTPGLFR